MARTFTAASTQYLHQDTAFLYPLTFAAWAQVTATNVDQCILTMGTAGSTPRRQMIYATSAGKVAIQSRDTAGTGTITVPTTAGISANTWFHVAGVVSAAASRAVYLNGANKVSDTTSIISTAPSVCYIGASTIPSLYINGIISEAGVWNVALTDAEIVALAANVPPWQIQPQSLWGYWPLMGDNSPETDYSGNSRSMTLSGSPTKSADPYTIILPPASAGFAPDAIVSSTNLTGAVTVLDEPAFPGSTDWLTATSATAATTVSVSFPTPS